MHSTIITNLIANGNKYDHGFDVSDDENDYRRCISGGMHEGSQSQELSIHETDDDDVQVPIVRIFGPIVKGKGLLLHEGHQKSQQQQKQQRQSAGCVNHRDGTTQNNKKDKNIKHTRQK